MADIAVTTAGDINVVGAPAEQYTAPTLEAIVAGAPVRFDPTTGKFRNGNATTETEAAVYGIALRSVRAGETVTAVKRGRLGGFALSGLDYGDAVLLSDTDGRIADAPGTVGVRMGTVVPAFGNLLSSSPDKLLDVDIVTLPPAAE